MCDGTKSKEELFSNILKDDITPYKSYLSSLDDATLNDIKKFFVEQTSQKVLKSRGSYGKKYSELTKLEMILGEIYEQRGENEKALQLYDFAGSEARGKYKELINKLADFRNESTPLVIFARGVQAARCSMDVAKEFYKQAADKGSVEASYALFLRELNSQQKFEMLKKLAEKGYAPAQHKLGKVYQYGWYGEKTDLEKAKELFTKSALQGEIDSISPLTLLEEKD